MGANFVDFKLIKEQVSMEMVLGHYGINLRRVNNTGLRGKCPLPTHTSEKSIESFSVQLEKNIWACQSASCAATRHGKKGGNVIDFVAIMEHSSIRDAALKMNDWFSSPPLRAPQSGAAEVEKGSGPTPKLVSEKRDDEVNRPLPFVLHGIDPTHSYLTARGIFEETARHFGIGFFSGRGSMVGRVVIPISNERGELVAYAGRAIDGGEQPKYKFPTGFKKAAVLFNLHHVRQLPSTANNDVIVVEGFFDCLKVWQSGFLNVVALMGSSLSEEQRKFLSEFTRVVLFLDGDEAGRVAARDIASVLVYQTFVKIVNLPDGKQPDQLSSEEIKTVFGSL